MQLRAMMSALLLKTIVDPELAIRTAVLEVVIAVLY